MQFVWALLTLAIIAHTTYMVFNDGFDRWWYMYLFIIITVIQLVRHRIQYKKITRALAEESAN
jgi:hypothetical protein